MPIADCDSEEFDPTTSDVSNEKGSVLYANVSTGQQSNGKSHNQIEIQVKNVVCNYSLPMHIDLRLVAMSSKDVTYDRSRGVLYKQKRDPSCLVKIYSSGSVYIVGCHSEEDCRRAARGIGRMVQRSMQKLNTTIRLRDFRISNMMSTCRLPFGVKIEDMAKKYPRANYEPELNVGLVWKFEDPKATLRIYTTGTISVVGTTSSSDVVTAIEMIYPLVEEFKCPLRYNETKSAAYQRRRRIPNGIVPVASEPPAKQARKTAPIYDPACSEFFEENMNLDEDMEEEENYYEQNFC